MASPCLWGKLHNLSFCFSAGVAVSIGEAATHCSSVAVSMWEAAKPSSLLVLWHRRVSMGKAAKLVSLLVQWRGRVYGGKLQNLVRFDVLTSPCL